MYSPKKFKMETLILKMMLSWAIMIIGFVALFAGCNNVRTTNDGSPLPAAKNDHLHDSVNNVLPDNTRTDGIKEKEILDTSAKGN
jgi:hypothetical protein